MGNEFMNVKFNMWSSVGW